MRSLIFALPLLFCSYLQGQTSLKNINLEQGPYAVGYDYVKLQDKSRTYNIQGQWSPNSISRPVPLSVWYPAAGKPSEDKRLKVLDYLRVLKIEEEWEQLPDSLILNWFYYAPTAENKKHLKETTGAYKKAKWAEGNFPVIIYAPSFQAASTENFALCELLASNGYIVISSPSRGVYDRLMNNYSAAANVEAQTRDIEFIISQLDRFPQANQSKIATMGFSFGGLAIALAQMRNDNIKAVVSLDGASKYRLETLRSSPFFSWAKADVPFIHFSQKDIPQQVLDEDGIDPRLNTEFQYFDSIASTRAFKVRMHHLTHGHFSSMGVLFNDRDPRQDKSDALIMASYKELTELTLKFLDAYLKDDQKARSFMEDQLPGDAKRLESISVSFKKGAERELNFKDFNVRAKARNYSDLFGLYKQLSLTEEQVPEWKLNNLGLQLFFTKETEAAGIAVLEFATELYPGSANLFDSLGEVQFMAKQYVAATKAFKKSLELNPQNSNAKKRLQQLGD